MHGRISNISQLLINRSTHDNDDILKVMDLKLKVTEYIFQKRTSLVEA